MGFGSFFKKLFKTIAQLAPLAIALFNPAAALGLSGFAATAFNFVASTALSAIAGGLGGSDDSSGGGGGRQSDSGFLVNNQGTQNFLPVVYGNRRVGGTRVYINTSEENGTVGTGNNQNQYMHIAVAICQGGVNDFGTDSIKRIPKMLFNDQVVYDADSAGLSGYDSNGMSNNYNDLVSLRLYYGDNDQDRDSPDVGPIGHSVNSFSSEWSRTSTSNGHHLKGVAYAYLVIKYDREKFPGLPTILFDVEGKKIRAKGSPGIYSSADNIRQNPALVLKDYLLSNRYGKGLAEADLDMTSFDTAADYCDSVSLEFNGAVNTSATVFSNVQRMLTAGNLNLVYSKGQYTVKPVEKISDAAFTTAFEFNESNITGAWNISLGSKRQKYNRLDVTYFDPANDWQPDSSRIEVAEYLSQDGGVENSKSIELPYTASRAEAERLGRFLLDQTRYQKVVQFTATHEALKCEVGDPVVVTHNSPDWTRERFRVSSLVLNQTGTVTVTLVEYMPNTQTDLSNRQPYLEDIA